MLYVRQKFRTSLFRKIRVNTCLGIDRRSVLMIKVKVNSKLELVEDREGKSALYRRLKNLHLSQLIVVRIMLNTS